MTADFRFDPETHKYYLRGKSIPGVTRVLSEMGYNQGSDFYTETSRERGQLVHQACELVDQYCPRAQTIEEVLEVLDLGPKQIPYITGYLLFRRETGFVPELQEVPVYSPKLRVAGKPDKYGRYVDGRRVLVDLKSWQSQGLKPKRSSEIQTALYALMLREQLCLETDLRVVLKLSGDHSYRAYQCVGMEDEAVGVYCCKVYWDRRNHGLIENCDDSEVELAA